MGNQQSLSAPSHSVQTPKSRASITDTTDVVVERSRNTSVTANSNPIEFISTELFSPKPPAAAAMKRPLPPPQSRNTVREEAKRAREVVDLCDGAEDGVPIAKKAKTGIEVHDEEPVRTLRCSSVGHYSPLEEATDSTDWQRRHPNFTPLAEAYIGVVDRLDVGAGVQKGNPTAEIANSEFEAPERRKKKLFGTLGANSVSVPAYNQRAASNGNVAVLGKPSSRVDPVGISQLQDEQSGGGANGATQPVLGQELDTFCKKLDSMFVDEGYGSITIPDGDDNDRVEENEDELMKRINDSLGLSSPFVQYDKAKIKKPATPVQIKAETQRKRDVEESRRMREANLTAKERERHQTATGGGGLSVDFLEDIEPRKDSVDSRTVKKTGSDNGAARIGHEKKYQGLMSGSKPPLINGQGQGSIFAAPTIKIANGRPANMSHAALLDIAENYVKNTSPNGLSKGTQRSLEGVTRSGKPETDIGNTGLNDTSETPTGYIQALEQQPNVGGHGEARTSGACDQERRQSIISQLTPKRKKRPELDIPQHSLPIGLQKSHNDELAAEARLLELQNAPSSGEVSSMPEKSPTLSKEGSLLDQLVRKREAQATALAASSTRREETFSTKGQNTLTESGKRRNHGKRAKATVEAAETVLLRMDIPPSLFKDWKDRRKCDWASREKTLTPKQQEILGKLIETHNTLHSASLASDSSVEKQAGNGKLMLTEASSRLNNASPVQRSPARPSNDNEVVGEARATSPRPVLRARNREKQSRIRLAEAEACLRDMGLPPADTADWSYQKKIKWADMEAEIDEKIRAKEALESAECERQKSSSGSTSLETPAKNGESEKEVALAQSEDFESEESEEEDGWQYAIRWQGTEQPKTLTDTVPLKPVMAEPEINLEGLGSDDEEEDVEILEEHPKPEPKSETRATSVVSSEKYRSRQAPDAELLRQMQRRYLDDWSDDDDDEQVHEYVVKADTRGTMTLPAHDFLILGRYIDKDKAEQKVRDFILSCKPQEMLRSLEIQSVWFDGNFSQKMIYNGEVAFRSFVEPQLVSARKYPDLTEKVARRKTYAVLFERTLSRNNSDRDGEVEEDIEATTIDDMQVFTTKSLANWEAKKVYLGWHEEHLKKPQDRCWLLTLDEDLCKYVEELDETGSLFSREQDIRKRGATDAMKVWVREIAPKGPRN